MKKIINLIVVVAVGSLICFQCTRNKLIPVTTASEKARTFYTEAVAAYEDVYFDRYVDLLVKAVKEDPEFFMANYRLSCYSLYSGDEKRFKDYGKRAADCKEILSDGEIIMKDAITQLQKKKDSDVRPLGKRLVKMYPEDVESYNQLYFYQNILKDVKGQEVTLKNALGVATNTAPLYNNLGYIYMNLGRNEEAAASFDKYIEMEPALPNPYDSKGDFYMFTKEYRKAYDNFMKANAIDSTWSYSKAMNAKSIADSLGMK